MAYTAITEATQTSEKIMTITNRAALKAQIDKHNHAYHTLDAPIITDAEYEALKRQYEAACVKDGVVSDLSVGAAPSSEFRQHTHSVPMLSLANAFSADDFDKFKARTQKRLHDLGLPSDIEWVAELKNDGLSLSLIYENGRLVTASTRGDGVTGEIVTQNAYQVASIPKQLTAPYPEHLEVRGECYMTKADFLALNERQAAKGGKLFATPRNAAAGSIRQSDPSIVADRSLSFVAYSIAHTSGKFPETQEQALALLHVLGFAVDLNTEFCTLETDAESVFNDFALIRADLPYDIDGVVFKVNNVACQRSLGSTGNTPNWAIAWKFPAEQAISTLEAIEIQVGRTGALTPVAHIKPINIGGVMVSRASLHNAEEIERKDIRVGDKIVVQRAGDVIPQVVSVVASEGGRKAPYTFPATCPCCGSATQKDGAVTRCMNDVGCKAQKVERLIYFASREAFDIDGLGDSVIRELFDAGLITSMASLFYLHILRPELEGRPNWGKASAAKLLDAIAAKKTIPLNRFINALGIRHVGNNTSKLLADVYGSVDDFIAAMRVARKDVEVMEDLKAIDGIGQITAASLVKYFDTPAYLQDAEDLADELTVTHTPAVSGGVLSGMTVVFTGTLSMKRSDAKLRAEAAGAKVSGSVSKKTDAVIVGAEPGDKADKARTLGVTIWSEADFVEITK